MNIRKKIAAGALALGLITGAGLATAPAANAAQIDRHGFSQQWICNASLAADIAYAYSTGAKRIIWAYCYYVKSKNQWYSTIAW